MFFYGKLWFQAHQYAQRIPRGKNKRVDFNKLAISIVETVLRDSRAESFGIVPKFRYATLVLFMWVHTRHLVGSRLPYLLEQSRLTLAY